MNDLLTFENTYLFYTLETSCGTLSDSLQLIASQECNCLVWIPNAFTPDDDGVNDAWFPVFSAPPYKYELLLFNRWGENIFETENYLQKWIGSHNNGKYYVQNDVYVYLVTYKCFSHDAEHVLRGHVVLVR